MQSDFNLRLRPSLSGFSTNAANRLNRRNLQVHTRSLLAGCDQNGKEWYRVNFQTISEITNYEYDGQSDADTTSKGGWRTDDMHADAQVLTTGGDRCEFMPDTTVGSTRTSITIGAEVSAGSSGAGGDTHRLLFFLDGRRSKITHNIKSKFLCKTAETLYVEIFGVKSGDIGGFIGTGQRCSKEAVEPAIASA